VGPLVNGDEALESLEKVSVAKERRGDGGGWNGRGEENRLREFGRTRKSTVGTYLKSGHVICHSSALAIPSPFPRRLRRGIPFSPISFAAMVSLECHRLVAPSLALVLAGTHSF
jgi:hypothetical protein